MAEQWLDLNAFQAPLADSYGPQPFFRDELDAFRSMWRRTPEGQYPDGYLGTITARRDDKLLRTLRSRETQRSYQRGVHKGERIDPGDYIWPEQFNLESGLKREATTGLRYAPPGGGMQPAVLTNYGKTSNQPYQRPFEEGRNGMAPRGVPSGFTNWPQPPQQIDPARAAQLARLAPGRSW
jgi:hypothetical protein